MSSSDSAPEVTFVIDVLGCVIDPELGSDIVAPGMADKVAVGDDGVVTLSGNLTTSGKGGLGKSTVNLAAAPAPMGFPVEKEESALMWRGLVLNRAVQHFLQDVAWPEDLDYLRIPGVIEIKSESMAGCTARMFDAINAALDVHHGATGTGTPPTAAATADAEAQDEATAS